MILVTGANGFLGKGLCQELTRRGIEHFPVYRDQFNLLNDVHVRRLYEVSKPTCVVHLAGNPNAAPNLQNPYKILDENVLMTQVLLENLPYQLQFIYASSATVYGTYLDFPKKSGFTEHDELMPTSVYGAYKMASEGLVKAFVGMRRCHGVILRLVANCGPSPSHGLIKAIIDKLVSPSEELELFGYEPGTSKPYIHTSDTINAIIKATTHLCVMDTYNISPFHTDVLSVKQVAQSIMNELNIHKPIKWLPDKVWPGDNPLVKVSNVKARSSLGWSPTMTSDSAVRAAAMEYYKQVKND